MILDSDKIRFAVSDSTSKSMFCFITDFGDRIVPLSVLDIWKFSTFTFFDFIRCYILRNTFIYRTKIVRILDMTILEKPLISFLAVNFCLMFSGCI